MTQIISSYSSSNSNCLLLVVESLVLCLLESVLLATLEHLEVTGFFGERAFGQGDQTSGMLLFWLSALVLALRIVFDLLRTFFRFACFSIAAFLGLITLLPVWGPVGLAPLEAEKNQS
jgi:hypothetical protein